jgi:hypothetical protein
MKTVKRVVVAVIVFFGTMTILSTMLYSKCRCTGRRFSPYLCLIKDWTPGIRSDLPSCRENLIVLETAKYEWARVRDGEAGDAVTWDDLRAYLNRGKPPICPRGGHYVLGLIGDEPDCVGACALHANPLDHALEPAIVYAEGETNPLASQRSVIRERMRTPRQIEPEAPSDEDDALPETE